MSREIGLELCERCRTIDNESFNTALDLLDVFKSIRHSFKKGDVVLKFVISQNGVWGMVAAYVNDNNLFNELDVDADSSVKRMGTSSVRLNVGLPDYTG